MPLLMNSYKNIGLGRLSYCLKERFSLQNYRTHFKKMLFTEAV
jgi:hypothetical protein